MKRRLTAFLCLLLIVMGILAMPALAANTCSQITGDSGSTRTFTVNTGSRWVGSDRLKLTQSKGVIRYNGNKTMNSYGVFYVTYTKQGGGTTTVKWKSSSLSLKLDKNSVYTVTVRPMSLSDMNWYRPFAVLSLKAYDSWSSYATWRVTATKGILSCS